MPSLEFEGRRLELAQGESVLDCLERHGARRPASCRSGVCQSCIMKVTAGALPSAAQTGLKDAWRAQGYFLPCVCAPTEDLQIADCDAGATLDATITAVQVLRPAIVRVRLQTHEPFCFAAGQFVSLIRPQDGLTRPYSIASLPDDGALELHVAVRDGGAMSSWLRDATGQDVRLRGPSGECFYQTRGPAQPLLLAGTGTGLAPLWGIVRAALQARHPAALHLYHASRSASGLYMHDRLRELASRHPNLSVHGLAADNDQGLPDLRSERLELAIASDLPKLAGFRVYLCGNPETVRRLKKQAFLAGASLQEIHSDPFIESAAR